MEYQATTLGTTLKINSKNKNFSINDIPVTIDLLEQNSKIHALYNNTSYNVELVEINELEKTVDVKVNGHVHKVIVKDKYDALLKSLGMDMLAAAKVNELKAPMPGLVLEIKVVEGTEVKKGDGIIVLEAMKMENILKSPTDGIIKKIRVTKGTAVEKNQVLIDFE